MGSHGTQWSKNHIGQQDNSKSDQPQHKLSIFILR
jgi:hypothetical protein